MTAAPRRAAARSERPWRRESAGSYRSSDERFEIQSEGSGRWFLVDEQEHDELGLPRTLGPFATLDAAKDAAAGQRAQPVEASPLAKRLAEAAARPKAESAPPLPKAASRAGKAANAAQTTKAVVAEAPRANPRTPAPPPKPPKPKTWIEALAERDAKAAARARTMITALVVEGASPAVADAAVRRELVDGAPAVAEARLAQAVADAVAKATEPRRVQQVAARLPADAGPSTAAAGLARAIADDLVDRLAAVLEQGGGHHAALPGWALVERPAGHRANSSDEPARELRLGTRSRRATARE